MGGRSIEFFELNLRVRSLWSASSSPASFADSNLNHVPVHSPKATSTLLRSTTRTIKLKPNSSFNRSTTSPPITNNTSLIRSLLLRLRPTTSRPILLLQQRRTMLLLLRYRRSTRRLVTADRVEGRDRRGTPRRVLERREGRVGLGG